MIEVILPSPIFMTGNSFTFHESVHVITPEDVTMVSSSKVKTFHWSVRIDEEEESKTYKVEEYEQA